MAPRQPVVGSGWCGGRRRYDRGMRRSVWIWLLILTWAPSVGAQRPSVSWLHASLLDRASVIVLARLESDEVLPVHQIQLTRFKVLQSIKGGNRQRVMVGGAGTRGGSFRELEKVVFLKRLKSDSIFELVYVVDLTEAERSFLESTSNDMVDSMEQARKKYQKKVNTSTENHAIGLMNRQTYVGSYKFNGPNSPNVCIA